MKNMINFTKDGEITMKKLGEVLSFCLIFHLSFAALLPILGVCGFLLLGGLF
jgi:hypothetical protein